MATINVAMKIGIVFVELDLRAAEMLVAAIGRPLHDSLTGTIMRQKVFQRAAFRRRIFGMGVIVIKPSAVGQDQIALHVMK